MTLIRMPWHLCTCFDTYPVWHLSACYDTYPDAMTLIRMLWHLSTMTLIRTLWHLSTCYDTYPQWHLSAMTLIRMLWHLSTCYATYPHAMTLIRYDTYLHAMTLISYCTYPHAMTLIGYDTYPHAMPLIHMLWHLSAECGNPWAILLVGSQGCLICLEYSVKFWTYHRQVTGDSVSRIFGWSANVSTQDGVVFKPCLETSASTNLLTAPKVCESLNRTLKVLLWDCFV